MLSKKISNYGMLTVSEQVILEIVHYVLNEYKPFIKCYYPIYERIKQKVISQQKNGVLIKIVKNEIYLRLNVSVLYGECISHITDQIKINLKKEILSLTSFNVGRIDIQVDDIHFDNI